MSQLAGGWVGARARRATLTAGVEIHFCSRSPPPQEAGAERWDGQAGAAGRSHACGECYLFLHYKKGGGRGAEDGEVNLMTQA